MKWILATAVLLLSILLAGCSDGTKQPVAPSSKNEDTEHVCAELPQILPTGYAIDDVKKLLIARTDAPLNTLVPEILDYLGNSYRPEDYYIDSLGLHWGKPKSISESAALGDCPHANGFSIVGSLHFVYWFPHRPASYNAYMAWIPIYAQPYGANGILVQKRDICWICGCNPVCALLWTWICAK
jgi:hypothetical protein